MIDLHIWESPLSIILLIIFILAILSVFGSKERFCSGIVRIALNRKVTFALILLFTLAIAFEGISGKGIYHSIPFIIISFLVMFSLGIASANSKIELSNSMNKLINILFSILITVVAGVATYRFGFRKTIPEATDYESVVSI